MKERVTFVLDAAGGGAYDPKKDLRLDGDALHVSSLAAAREDRFTFSTDELPQEIWLALKQCHELHIRWSSPNAYAAPAPFSSRLSPGLHVFYTPRQVPSKQQDDLVCPTLQRVFSSRLPCASPNETFTAIPVLSERFAASAAFNYHARLDSLDELIMYVLQKACGYEDGPCTERLAALTSANSLDVDWDVISQTLVLKTYSQAPPSPLSQTFRRVDDAALEVGVLSPQAPVPALPENLALGGYLAALGKDSKPDAVEFTFAARHHGSEGVYEARFLEPTGLHPTLRLSVAAETPPKAPHCRLHAFVTLPSVLFPDKYQLSAPLFLASRNLGPLRAVWGETDLEAPDWAVSRWGSSMLIELAPPADGAGAFDADIPLHLRYLAPTSGGLQPGHVPWPVVFWACRADEGPKMATSPFDRVSLGFDGLFGPKTVFFHLQPNASAHDSLLADLHVPVLNADKIAWLPASTASVLLVGLLWVLWKLVGVSQGVAKRSAAEVQDKKRI